MIAEIISLLIRGAYEVFMSTANGVSLGAQYFMQAVAVFRAGAGSAHPLETVVVLGLFGTGGYLMYKFLWDSAKEIVIIVIAIFLLFFIATFVA